ncbi:MAG: DUF805 domain-containing protein [Deltaproteobacteria bacterium]|nr:DUF805 domain-containing protein [Deltaproteobacteria bacterium]
MTYSEIWFSCKGRIPRSTYWLKFYLPLFVLYFVFMFIFMSSAVSSAESLQAGNNAAMSGMMGAMSAAWGLFVLITIYPSIAVSIKRAHDRGRSGWFILLYFVPIVSLWPAIELGFFKGTTGTNAYGDDPLGPAKLSTAPTAAHGFDNTPIT